MRFDTIIFYRLMPKILDIHFLNTLFFQIRNNPLQVLSPIKIRIKQYFFSLFRTSSKDIEICKILRHNQKMRKYKTQNKKRHATGKNILFHFLFYLYIHNFTHKNDKKRIYRQDMTYTNINVVHHKKNKISKKRNDQEKFFFPR